VKNIIAAGAIALAVLGHGLMTSGWLESDRLWPDPNRPVPHGCTVTVTAGTMGNLLPIVHCPIWVNG